MANTMTKGTLTGLGVGPGDPELLTLKGARILQEADIIVVPDKGSGEKTALNIVKEHIDGKELLFCATPMVRDKEELDQAYDLIADQLSALLDQGKNLVFITLGDPAIYSTYVYVHQRMVRLGYSPTWVPGVPSFCAVAATLGVSLCERGEPLLIVPASHQDGEAALATQANLVFMKAGREMGELCATLERHGLLEKTAMVENCGMAGEKIYRDLRELPEDSGYFSIVLVKR